MHHIVFIHLSIRGPSVCFHRWGIVNNTTVNMGACVSARVSAFSFWGYAQKRIAGSYSNSAFNCSRCFRTVFHSGCASFHSHEQGTGARFLDTLTSAGCVPLFGWQDPHGCESFDSRLPNDLQCWLVVLLSYYLSCLVACASAVLIAALCSMA